MKVREAAAGVWVVEYEAPEDLAPERQAPVVAELERAAAARPTALVFQVPPSVRMVSVDVPSYWLEVTARRELRLASIAITTNSAAVRAAANGFALANRLRNLPVEVRAFTELEDSVEWAKSRCDAAATR